MKLFATLSTNMIRTLTQVIRSASLLPSISTEDLLKEIQENGIQSPYFSRLKFYFSKVFGSYSQTVRIDDHLLQICYLTQQPQIIFSRLIIYA